jgi:hypothetical protein
VKNMAKLKQQETGLPGTDQGESSGGRVPPNRAASGSWKAHEALPAGQRVPKLTSSSGDLEGSSGKTFSKTDPYARKQDRAGGR